MVEEVPTLLTVKGGHVTCPSELGPVSRRTGRERGTGRADCQGKKGEHRCKRECATVLTHAEKSSLYSDSAHFSC